MRRYEMMFRTQTEEARFMEDVATVVGDQPVLFSDLLETLRKGWGWDFRVKLPNRWRGLNNQRVEATLWAYGYHFSYRQHGAGVAVYVSRQPISSVIDRFGKEVAVSPF